MSHQFTLSKRGRRLIKAFEGFRPVDRTLVSGQRVVGYGHKVRRSEAMTVTRSEANALLRSDLAPYEDMINTEVHAPLNQNQFDALVSLAFSIGPKAFLESPTLQLLNIGRPLDAARSIEIWRKSRIDGRAYVIDALVRRRAMEKAMFLRPVAGIVTASRVNLPSVEDSEMRSRLWDEDLPVFEDEAIGFTAQVNYDAEEIPAYYTETEDYSEPEEDVNAPIPLTTYTRRREDGPAGVLTLSEVVDDDDYENVYEDADDYEADFDADAYPDSDRPSPIALAAAEVSERLDALIAGADADQDLGPNTSASSDWPESLITADTSEGYVTHDEEDVNYGSPEDTEMSAPPAFLTDKAEDLGEEILANDISDEDIKEELSGIANKLLDSGKAETVYGDVEFGNLPQEYTQNEGIGLVPDVSLPQPRGLGPYLVMIVTGLTFMGASLGAMMRGGDTRLGENMPFWASVGLIVGSAIVLFALYYVLKSILRRN